MKKNKKNWYIALTYYIYANLLGIVPLVIVSVLINMFANSKWMFAITSIVTSGFIYYFALKISSKNINKNYIIPKVSEIVTWTLYYLIILNGIGIFIFIKSQGYLSMNSLVSIVNVILSAIIIEKFSKSFLIESKQGEVI